MLGNLHQINLYSSIIRIQNNAMYEKNYNKIIPKFNQNLPKFTKIYKRFAKFFRNLQKFT